jgi:hypothetical protein
VLTNVSGSALPARIRDTVFNNLVGKPEAPVASGETVAPQQEAGKYNMGNLNIEIIFKDDKLRANVPGQPEYELTNAGGRRYKLGPPAPDGFFVTFRPVKGNETDTEMYLEQPQGNIVLLKAKPGGDKGAATANLPKYRELIGKYEIMGTSVEITTKEDKVMFSVPGQPAYTLVEKEKDVFGALELPDTYRLTFKRSEAGEITGFKMKQPEGEFDVKRISGPPAPAHDITIDELMAKSIAASGGEANLRKHKSMTITTALDFESQGLTGENIAYAQAPNLAASTTTLMGLGKKIATLRSYFDGTNGGSETSFSLKETYKDKQLEDARIAADFHEQSNWKSLYKTVAIKGKSKVGDEEVYVVVKTPEKGNPVTDYISTKSFLLIKRDRSVSAGGGQATVTIGETYSDYRSVDGVMMPFGSVTQHPSMGRVVGKVKEVKFDANIPAIAFRATAK